MIDLKGKDTVERIILKQFYRKVKRLKAFINRC
jgi:hypothetical protein